MSRGNHRSARCSGAPVTLIAAAGVDTFPAIFGGLPVSDRAHSSSTADIPFVGATAVGVPSESDAFAPQPSQKVVLLGDNCVIAWAGSVDVAREAIIDLQAIASEAPLSMPIIDACFSKLGPGMRDEVSFVGWVKEQDVFHQFWYRADIAEGAMFGRISAAGSGSTDFVKHAAQISGGTLNVLGEAPTALVRAISSMLSATSLLTQAQLSSQSDPLNAFCGGYEIATYVGDKFAKIGDIAWVFWTANVAEGLIELGGPRLVLKQDYAGEILLLRELRIQSTGASANPPGGEETRQVISPFGRAVDATLSSDLSWPGPEAAFTCHVVVVRSVKARAIVNRIEFSPSGTPSSIRFRSDEGRGGFEAGEAFRDELRETIRAGLADG